MHSNSRSVSSSQSGVHRQLASVVARHPSCTFQKPCADYNRQAFDQSMAAWQRASMPPLILDTGCGVGLSTRHLALAYPAHFVIGVDRSADRLSRNSEWTHPVPPNMFLVRADLIDYWRLLHDAGVRLARHYMLYPNPWPKAGQLGRRWHAHPVFPTAVALGGVFECRSNWSIYVEECAAALAQLTGRNIEARTYVPETVITPFERKYLSSGQTLWRCVMDEAPSPA